MAHSVIAVAPGYNPARTDLQADATPSPPSRAVNPPNSLKMNDVRYRTRVRQGNSTVCRLVSLTQGKYSLCLLFVIAIRDSRRLVYQLVYMAAGFWPTSIVIEHLNHRTALDLVNIQTERRGTVEWRETSQCGRNDLGGVGNGRRGEFIEGELARRQEAQRLTATLPRREQ